jgi:hypothetical protein
VTDLNTTRLESEILKAFDALGPFVAGDLFQAIGPASFDKISKGGAGEFLRRNLDDDGYEFAGGAAVEAGIFSPGFSFGDATTGIAYTNQTGVYRKIGSLVLATGQITLSSKGSATGIARLTGLPFTALAGLGGQALSVSSYSGFTGLTGMPHSLINAGAMSAFLYQHAAAASSVLQNTHFTNTSDFRFSATYIVN